MSLTVGALRDAAGDAEGLPLSSGDAVFGKVAAAEEEGAPVALLGALAAPLRVAASTGLSVTVYEIKAEPEGTAPVLLCVAEAQLLPEAPPPKAPPLLALTALLPVPTAPLLLPQELAVGALLRVGGMPLNVESNVADGDFDAVSVTPLDKVASALALPGATEAVAEGVASVEPLPPSPLPPRRPAVPVAGALLLGGAVWPDVGEIAMELEPTMLPLWVAEDPPLCVAAATVPLPLALWEPLAEPCEEALRETPGEPLVEGCTGVPDPVALWQGVPLREGRTLGDGGALRDCEGEAWGEADEEAQGVMLGLRGGEPEPDGLRNGVRESLGLAEGIGDAVGDTDWEGKAEGAPLILKSAVVVRVAGAGEGDGLAVAQTVGKIVAGGEGVMVAERSEVREAPAEVEGKILSEPRGELVDEGGPGEPVGMSAVALLLIVPWLAVADTEGGPLEDGAALVDHPPLAVPPTA